jgi:hypothetical protein
LILMSRTLINIDCQRWLKRRDSFSLLLDHRLVLGLQGKFDERILQAQLGRLAMSSTSA